MMIIDDYLKYEEEHKDYINLVASENIMSKQAKIPLQGDVYNRYSFENSQNIYFPCRRQLVEIEKKCERLIAGLLDSKYISVKPISGLNGMLCVLGIYLKPGDCVYTLDPDCGGHNVTAYMAKRMGIQCKYIPFDEETMEIDYLKLVELLKKDCPRMIYIDHMNVTFPIDTKKLRNAVGKKIYIVYDISHLMALVMGKVISNPLLEGVDILVGSTHKTLPGPHKAIFATNSSILFRMFDMMNGAFISSQHVSEVVALGIVVEQLQMHMQGYAQQMVANAQVLAKTLNTQGINVLFEEKNFTQTHQIWIVDKKYSTKEIVDSLAEYKILTNALMIPFVKSFGIRIGVQEITYKGFKEEQMIELALVISEVIMNKVSNSTIERVDSLIRILKQEA